MVDGERKALKKAQTHVYRLLKIRPRSEEEIRAKLRQKKFTQDVIEETLKHFKDSHLIDDRHFARAWIVPRLSRPFGSQRIQYELIQKGVDLQIIKDELKKAMIDYREDELVLDLARRRLSQYRRLEPSKARDRLAGFLGRRGFSQDAIKRTIEKLL